jgi:phospholipid-binding lipoprotein MlaA
VKKLLASAAMMFFFSMVCLCNSVFSMDNEPGTYILAQQNQQETAEKDEDDDEDEEFEEDDEYADDVVQINDPLYRFNQEMYLINDGLYVVFIKPTAKVYNKIIPVEIRTCVKNFFYNLRFPIRFVNCLLQAKGLKAMEEFATFFLNSTVGFAGIGDVASYYENLPPSPEDLGQTLAVWGADNGFYIMFPILGPSSLRDSARFIDSYFLDPVSWLRYDKFGGYSWRTTAAITAYDKYNEISFQIDDIDALKKAVFDPYVAVRDAYVESRNKLIDE